MLKATRWELNDRSFLSRMGNVFRPSTALTQRGHRPVLLKKHAFQGTFVLFFAPGYIFTKDQLYQVDSVGFSAVAYFKMLTPQN